MVREAEKAGALNNLIPETPLEGSRGGMSHSSASQALMYMQVIGDSY